MSHYDFSHLDFSIPYTSHLTQNFHHIGEHVILTIGLWRLRDPESHCHFHLDASRFEVCESVMRQNHGLLCFFSDACVLSHARFFGVYKLPFFHANFFHVHASYHFVHCIFWTSRMFSPFQQLLQLGMIFASLWPIC